MDVCFRFFLSHYLAIFSSEQTGWLDFLFFSPLYIPKIQAYFVTVDTTLLCSMIASWNGLIFRRMGYWVRAIKSNRLGKWGHGQKIPFRFLFLEFMVRLNWAY
jgi:hypothetical protein